MSENKRIYYLSVAGCILVLIIAGWKWSVGLQGHLDILLADEAEYLRNGLNLFDKIAKNWGPTYNIWYKFLSLFNSNPIELYYLNYKIGAIGTGVLLFVFLIRYNVHIAVAFLIGFCFLFSDININAWPRISNFVVMLYLAYFISIRTVTSINTKLIGFAIVSFVAAFARPELLIVAEISTILVLINIVRDYKNAVAKIPLLLLLFITVFILFYVYGKPADTYSNINRTYIAFCQHYAVAYKMRTHSDMNAIIEWIDFTKPLFGDSKTVPEVLFKHFSLCVPHFLFTIKVYALSFFMFILNLVSPVYLIPGMKKKQILLIALLVFILFALFHKKTRTSFLSKIKEQKSILLFAFAASIPSIGVCIVIFPRQHYMMIQVIWMALLLGFLFSAVLENLKIKDLAVVPLSIILLFLSPKAEKYNTIQSIPDIKNLCTQKFIHYINAQPWTEKHTIFSNFLNVHLLFNKPENFEQFNTEYMLKQLPATIGFKDILEKYKIDIILMNSELDKETRLQKDTTWQQLTAHPELYQFKKVSFANECESYLLIKNK